MVHQLIFYPLLVDPADLALLQFDKLNKLVVVKLLRQLAQVRLRVDIHALLQLLDGGLHLRQLLVPALHLVLQRAV